jgi:hypothetical protein
MTSLQHLNYQKYQKSYAALLDQTLPEQQVAD